MVPGSREHEDVIELRVLGPIEVLREGEPVHIPGDRERSVLAILAMERGAVVSTDRLIEALWGEALPNNPGNALQAIVSRLRRALGRPGLIVTKKPGYALEIDARSIDSARFEELVRRATKLGADDPSRASDLLAEALSLWRGPVYADLAYQDVAQQERARLEVLRIAAEEEKIGADLALGRSAEALAELERLVVEHPLRERLRAQLMLALYRAGRQGDAVTAYHETRRVLGEELGLDPGPELENTYQLILRQDPSLQRVMPQEDARRPTNLPSRATSFVGREVDVEDVTRHVHNNRLVTVIGPGGAGKTSLAVEVARGLVNSFDRGVWLVDIAPVADGDLVVAAISDALGLVEDTSIATAKQSPAARLSTYLANKQLLVVLDNCEHLVQASAEVADVLLASCPNLKILATSREVLAAPGEFVWTIPPLAIPAPDADVAALSSYDAVRLLEQRATSAGAKIALDGEDGVAAGQICRRLDGLPLAIELAAARARSMALPEIARRLDERFGLLAAGGRTTAPRHRTLRAAIDWSYDLLSASERVLFRRLAVFWGGWTLAAAEQVCGGEDVGDAVDVLGRLVEQSLVVVRGDRYRMLETIRAYAGEHLVAADENSVLRERHAGFFKDFAESIEPDLRGVDQGRALRRLRNEEYNLRMGLQWARENADDHPELGLGLAAALGWYWYVGRQVEGRSELKSMLAAADEASEKTRARALQALSLSLRPAGCIVHASPEAAQVARASVSLFDTVGDERGAAMSQLLVAVEGVAGGDVSGFLDTVDSARSRLRDGGDAWGVALADFIEMEIRLYHDSPDVALALGEQAATQFDALDDDWGRSAVRLHLGFGMRLAGRTEEAREVLDRAVAISRETGLPNNLARSLVELGEVFVNIGDVEEADRWFRACDDIVADLADDAMKALVASGRGDAARYRNESKEALAHYDEALTLYRRSGVPRGIARALVGLGAAELDLGRLDRAEELLGEVLPKARDSDAPAIHAAALEQVGRLAVRQGRARDATGLVEEAESIRVQYRRPRGALAARDVAEAGHRVADPTT